MIMPHIFYISLILTLASVCKIPAQEANHSFDYRIWDVEDGLSSRKVTTVAQDAQGLIWIGTEQGLHTFDGENIHNVTEELNLTHRGIERILADTFGFLLIHSDFGVEVIDVYRRQLIKKNNPSMKDSLSKIEFVGMSSEGYFLAKIWNGPLATFRNGFWNYIADTEHVSISNNSSYYTDWSFYKVNFLEFQSDGKYYLEKRINGKPGAIRYDTSFQVLDTILSKTAPKSKLSKSLSFDHLKEIENSSGYRRLTFQSDQKGKIFSVPPFRGSTSDFRKARDSLPEISDAQFATALDKKPLFLKVNNSDYIFVVTSKGLISMNIHTGIKEMVAPISIRNVGEILKDQTGSIWIPTYLGLIQLIPSKQIFTSFLKLGKPEPEFYNSVRVMQELDSNQILFSTKTHVLIWDRSNDVLDTIHNIGKKQIWDFEPGPDSTMWMLNEYSVHASRNGRTLTPYQRASPGLFAMIIRNTESKLLMIGDRVFKVFDERSQKWTSREWSFINTRAWLQNSDGTIWVGHERGLSLLNDDFEEIEYDKLELFPELSSHRINHIYKDNQGKLWLSTNGGGVKIVDFEHATFNQIGTNNGLPNNTVYSTISKGNNYVFPTDNGLAVYNKRYEFVHSFTTKDGLAHHEFNYPGFLSTANGDILLGTLNGITILPNDIDINQSLKVPIFVSEISVYNSRKDQKIKYDLFPTRENPILIRPGDTNIQFRYGMADFRNPTGNVYKYRIKDYTNGWESNGFSNVINYGSLPPGKHVLEIQGATSNGILNQNTLEIPIHVKRPFTQSIWFFLLIAFSVAAISFLIHEIRMNQINKLVSVRQQIAMNLHDDVGSIMTLISLESDLIQSDIYDKETKNRKVNMIASKSREASKTMSDIVWSFDARQDHIKDLIGRMKNYTQEMLTPINVVYTFTTEGMKDEAKINPLIRQNIYLIYKEAINNIVKHSHATEVKIDLFNRTGIFKMSILDNGKGEVLKKSPSGGQGIRNMKIRAEKINAKLSIDDKGGYHLELKMDQI